MLAQARGFTKRRVLWRHAVRPSSLSLLTAVGLNTAGLIGGALVAEILFAIPGMGRLAINAVFGEDYDVVMAVTLLLSIGFIVVNFLVDLLYAAVDPRIRHGSR
jgi:peptide/nickel transport system permease protein